jgi:PAS domain-containing protein
MPDGSVREWVGTFSDVHDQRLAQEQLAASEERLRLATEVTGLGTYSVDLRTGVREWSESMRALLGISHDEPIGFDVFAARVHPEDLSGHTAGTRRFNLKASRFMLSSELSVPTTGRYVGIWHQWNASG